MFYLPVILRKLSACELHLYRRDTRSEGSLTQKRQRKGPGCQRVTHPGQSRAEHSRKDFSKVRSVGQWRHFICRDNI